MHYTAGNQSPSTTRYSLIPRTLTLIFNNAHILLIRAAPSKPLWPNLYNGIGGHVERGETIEQAALREIREETGINAIVDLRLRGTITIDVSQQTGIILFVFTGTSTATSIRPSPEGEPHWVPVNALSSIPCVQDLPDLVIRIQRMDDTAPPFHIHYPIGQLTTLDENSS